MLFNSLTYLLFMLALAPLAVFGPAPLRKAIFLFGSIAFYAFWRIDFTALVLFTAYVDYFGANQIYRSTDRSTKKMWLILSLVMNLTVLGFFKYFKFLIYSGVSIASATGIDAHLSPGFDQFLKSIILPLGISFYTFHSLSYVFDVYRGLIKPVKGFAPFITYVMFWTQLVAGPILRTSEVVPQLVDYRRPSRGEVVYGLEEILQGLFKKLVIADQIAEVVNAGFAVPPAQLGTLDVWTLAFGFGFQIYFDFSGYSQIALGSARVMGFHFPPNFNWPYLASSPREFWKRWHISLSSWIRDYLYLPLQGTTFKAGGVRGLETDPEQQVTEARRTFALFATWFIMGLWHGANWTFALWGLWHASLIYGHRYISRYTEALPRGVRVVGGWCLTLPLAMLGWIFFRALTVRDSFEMIATAFNPTRLRRMSLRENDYLLVFCVMVGLLAVAAMVRLKPATPRPALVRYPAMAVAAAIMFFGVFLTLRQVKSFIYFQF